MPHGNRAAIMVAVGLSAAAAPIPALGQTPPALGQTPPAFGQTPPPPGQTPYPGDPTTRLGRPSAPLPRFEEPRRDYSPSPSPWSAAPTSRPGSSPGGITQWQAMDILAAAGFTEIDPPVPRLDGSWTASVINRSGRRVRASVDVYGDVSVGYR